MKVGALRDCNVTLHLSLTAAKREQVPDIPAVYFIRKQVIITLIDCLDDVSDTAFKKIAEDAMNGVYDYFFINFMKPVTPE